CARLSRSTDDPLALAAPAIFSMAAGGTIFRAALLRAAGRSSELRTLPPNSPRDPHPRSQCNSGPGLSQPAPRDLPDGKDERPGQRGFSVLRAIRISVAESGLAVFSMKTQAGGSAAARSLARLDGRRKSVSSFAASLASAAASKPGRLK